MLQAHDAAPWLVPDWPQAPANIGFLCTTRRGGVSQAPYDDGAGAGGLNLGIHVQDRPEDVVRNRALLRAVLPAEPAWLNQVHGATVVRADRMAADEAPDADAAIACAPGAVCTVMTADCLPVLFCDRAGTVVGAAHAGWRGLAGGVLEATVAGMRQAGAGEIIAWLGPAIGPRQFEVGAEVEAAFVAGAAGDEAAVRAAFRPLPGRAGKFLADIYALARTVLARVGVRDVAGGTHCTVSEGQTFYSYRRDRVTGRQATLIWIKE